MYNNNFIRSFAFILIYTVVTGYVICIREMGNADNILAEKLEMKKLLGRLRVEKITLRITFDSLNVKEWTRFIWCNGGLL